MICFYVCSGIVLCNFAPCLYAPRHFNYVAASFFIKSLSLSQRVTTVVSYGTDAAMNTGFSPITIIVVVNKLLMQVSVNHDLFGVLICVPVFRYVYFGVISTLWLSALLY